MTSFVYIGGEPVSMYFLMGLSGLLFAVVIALIKRNAFNLRARDVLRVAAFAAIGAVAGARLFSAVGQIVLHGGEPGFWAAGNWRRILSGGGVFYGGLFGSIGLAALRARLCHLNMKSVFHVAAYAVFAFQSLARLGCWFAGCCYGVMLPHGARFPVQLLEAGFCFAVLVAFLIVKPERRWPWLGISSSTNLLW